MALWIRAWLLAATVLAAGGALAAPCAGFDDVDSDSPFCAGVEWIRNRGITTGCVPLNFCPDLPVSRLAMAAFLSRMDRVLPPTMVDKDGRALGAVTLRGPDEPVLVYKRAWHYALYLPLAYDATAGGFAYVTTLVHFDTAGCQGNAYVSVDSWPPSAHAHKLGVLARRSPAGEVLVFRTTQTTWPPVPPVGLLAVSRLEDDGTCTDHAPMPLALPVAYQIVENIASQFLLPFQIR
ncbi:MAG TPA: hypothetical protein VFX05_04050 [Casimicrobiaceae bacterium]|nr:hypothetical protein [Casimicrobiaceae bacterium]